MTEKNLTLANEIICAKAAVASLRVLELPEPSPFPSQWDETCILVRDDNLRALQGLFLSGVAVDFCYIDPPYNTGNTFVFEDNRRKKSVGPWGSHAPWMTFMLPRLVFARETLNQGGILAVSIDDHAYSQLKVLLDVVFGEDCSLGTLVVVRSKNGLGSNKNVADMHEYVLLYGKDPSVKLRGVRERASRSYKKTDSHGSFTIDGLFRKKGEASRREDRPNMYYPLYVAKTGEVYTERVRLGLKEVYPLDSQGIERRWLWGREKATQESWKLFSSPGGVVYVKNYANDDKRVRLRSVIDGPEYLTDAATRESKEVFGEKLFETPKPLRLITDLVDCCSDEDALVLDFFAGSGTTGAAVAELNAKAGGCRRVILVEHQALVPSGHAAQARGLATTADITAARLEYVASKHPLFTVRDCKA